MRKKMYRPRLKLAARETKQIISGLIISFLIFSFSEGVINPRVTFHQSSKSLDCYDYVEIWFEVDSPDEGNPFTEVTLSGEFGLTGKSPNKADGFCDSEDGSVYRIRFMPIEPGRYEYAIRLHGPGLDAGKTGSFTAHKGKRKGIVRVDSKYPWHFVWDGTAEHFFWNSTTTYWLLGWRDESIIRESLDRLAKLKINRIRVALNGRTTDGMRWKELLAMPDAQFQYRLEPWPTARPKNVQDPGYDVTRFNLEHFRKAERMLKYARERNIIVSLIFHLDGRDAGVDPFGKAAMGGEDEQRYYRYCVARFGAFANIMWDITNEWHLFRDEAWVNKMGELIKQCDPYDHTTSVHGTGHFPFRTSPWCDFAMYQCWDEHGSYEFMLKNRREQAQTGRPMPQVNEEYGYEDHYPFPWGEKRKWPLRIAESRRKLAWEMTMAGCYQTTGERANILGYGGWITGRGNSEMIMLEGYARMKEFFEKLPWWRLEPRTESATDSAMCLAEAGRLYVVYLPNGGKTTLSLEDGPYSVTRFNPRNGATLKLKDVVQKKWTSPLMPDTEDWVLLLKKR